MAAEPAIGSTAEAKQAPSPPSPPSPPLKISHVKHLFDQAGVTDQVLNHRYMGEGTPESPFIVEYVPGDPYNPMKFSKATRWTYALIMAAATLAVSFSSSAYASEAADVMEEFGASTNVAVLGISLFVLGFAIGPVFWAPLSEFYGRQIIYAATYLPLAALNAGAIGSKNIATLLVLRFLAGSFGSSPLTNAAGVVADMFDANERTLALAIFVGSAFLGPSIGPIASGFLVEAAGWKWNQGLMAIFTGIIFFVGSAVVPETYTPYLLRTRAAKLSQLTGKVYLSKMDSINPKTMKQQFKTAFLRPWVMLFWEPIVLITSIYVAIVYGTLYLLFAAFPVIFTELRGWNLGMTGSAFAGIAVGMLFTVFYYIFVEQKRYLRVVEAHGGIAPPEARLPPAIIGSVLLPVGLFWFAWTNGPEIHWIVPIIGTAFFGSGLVFVFLGLINYLVDSYVVFAASVLAANSVLRSIFGAVFPLFTPIIYSRLNVHWASSIPAFLALACAPGPLLFYLYGRRIRSKCKFAAEAAETLKNMLGGAAAARSEQTLAVDSD